MFFINKFFINKLIFKFINKNINIINKNINKKIKEKVFIIHWWKRE